MASLSLINAYLAANALFVLVVALFAGLKTLNARLPNPAAYRHQLQLAYSLVAACLLLALASPLWGHENFLPTTAQVWSAATMHESTTPSPEAQRSAVSVASSATALPLAAISKAAAVAFITGLLGVLIKLGFDALALRRIFANAQHIRRQGQLKILVSEQIEVPLSFWLPGSHFIVVPSSLLPRAEDLRMAIRHEVQHHRQLDTKALYFFQLLKALFFWNPAIYRIERTVAELQEFACDEALAAHRKVSAEAYCQCLLRVAEKAVGGRRYPITASMGGSAAKPIFYRRIAIMLTRPTHHLRWSLVTVTGIVSFILMAAAAIAVTAPIQDRRITTADASRMAVAARQGSDFPIAVNDQVVAELNRFLGTPDGRAYMQAGIARMKNYQALLSERIAMHGMPMELLAVPLIESGYRNLPQDNNPRHGAGVWMFIAPTARNFGLAVDAGKDERLDVAKETDAAMRMLSGLNSQYNDWGLALLAYNSGKPLVEKAIRETGSRDVWHVIGKGYENDPSYVPRVMAAVLIMKNPSILE